MRKLSLLAILAVLLISCGNSLNEKEERQLTEASIDFPANFTAVGNHFTAEEVLDVHQMNERYRELKVGDTVQLKFRAAVSSVCKNKGCWMKLDLKDGEETMVRFKDYAFFVPKEIEEKNVVVNGKAYISRMSVEDQRHFAEDAGESPENIAAITTPKKTLSFLAEGVIIEE